MGAPVLQGCRLGAEREPDWPRWNASEPYTIGIEEEVMVLEPDHAAAETHRAVIELATSPHRTIAAAADQAAALRAG
jgi:glutamate---cysteine ligase / carboxylate-amine ligase